MSSLVLGKYKNKELVYKGHVTLGVSGSDFAKIKNNGTLPQAPLKAPKGNEDTVWIIPNLVCKVQYMELSKKGSMRQPVFKGLRDDKAAIECIEK